MTNIELYFTHYPSSNQCFETSDSFLFHEKPLAEAHAITLKDKKVNIHTRLSIEPVQEAKVQIIGMSDLIAAIELADSIDALKALLPEGEKRKTVLAAYEKRMDVVGDQQ